MPSSYDDLGVIPRRKPNKWAYALLVLITLFTIFNFIVNLLNFLEFYYFLDYPWKISFLNLFQNKHASLFSIFIYFVYERFSISPNST